MPKAKYFVEERIAGKLVTTEFDSLRGAKIYQEKSPGKRTIRLPKETAFTGKQNGVFAAALFNAIERGGR